MPSKIVIPRRIYLPALIVVSLLVALVIGSVGIRAQGICEYVTFTTVCVRPDGAIRIVADPAECKNKEEVGYLANKDILTCALGYEEVARTAADTALEGRISDLEARLDACEACP
jgi:hypothetical protein